MALYLYRIEIHRVEDEGEPSYEYDTSRARIHARSCALFREDPYGYHSACPCDFRIQRIEIPPLSSRNLAVYLLNGKAFQTVTEMSPPRYFQIEPVRDPDEEEG